MNQDVIDLTDLLKERHRFVLKRYEMSRATLRQLEHQLADNRVPPKPGETWPATLWGIPIHFDDKIPFGEIDPVYA